MNVMQTTSVSDSFLRKLRSGELYKLGLLAVAVAMNLRTFEFFPGVRNLEEGWFLLCIFTFFILYPLFKIRRDWTFSGIEFYLLLMMPVLLLLTAFGANQEFGQPIFYGILAKRSAVLLLMWLVFVVTWRARWITAKEVETVLVWLAWGTFFLYAIMRFLLNPASFPGAPPGFILGSLTTQAYFAVPGCFMTFAVLYYTFRGIRERQGRFYVYAVLFFFNALGSSGRFLAVSLLVTTGFFLTRWRSASAALSLLVRFAILAAVGSAVFYVVNPAVLQERAAHFAAAFAVVAGGQGADASANARTVETDIALPYIKRHPLIGNGILSAQWSGSADAIATYFFSDDIGIVGIVFNYGFIGFSLFLLQYIFAIRAAMQIPREVHTPLIDAAKGFILYTAIYSLTTGLFAFSFEQSAFFILLLVLLAEDFRAKNLTQREAPPSFAPAYLTHEPAL